MLPISVIVPVAVTVAVSLFTRPSMLASAFVSAVPSYALLSEPVVIVTGACSTVSVPPAFFTFVKLSVLFSPAAFLITYPSFTTFALLPASVWLPLAVASTVNPAGRPLAVTVLFVSAVPSYVLLPLAAVSVTSPLFSVIVSVPSFSVIV